jgi:hypothetical protein
MRGGILLKHLAREAQPTVSFIDEYCAGYKDLFPEVRSYECFKYLHLGIIAPIKKFFARNSQSCRNKICPIVTSFYLYSSTIKS